VHCRLPGSDTIQGCVRSYKQITVTDSGTCAEVTFVRQFIVGDLLQFRSCFQNVRSTKPADRVQTLTNQLNGSIKLTAQPRTTSFFAGFCIDTVNAPAVGDPVQVTIMQHRRRDISTSIA
jgi:hypothetical protein